MYYYYYELLKNYINILIIIKQLLIDSTNVFSCFISLDNS